MQNIRLIRALLIPLFLEVVPLVASQTLDGWNWSPLDYVFFYILLAGAGVAYVLITKHSSSAAQRAAVGVTVLASLLLIWVNGAVGIIGDENNIANVLYLAVPGIGLLGAAASRLRPEGLARTSFIMAVATALVPVAAFLYWKPLLNEPPGMAGVIMINAFFVFLFVFAGILFQNARTEATNQQAA